MVVPEFTPREHGALQRLWRSLAYNLHTYVGRRPHITADLPWLGVTLRTGSEDMLGRRLYKTGLYERDVTHFLLRYLTAAPQDAVFDVGANVGYYSLLVHRVCGPSVPVHAFEAEPENFAQLQHNLERAGAASVTPHHCAVSDRAGEVRLFLWKRSNRGKHSLVPFDGAAGDEASVDVQARTLDELAAELIGDREVSLLKIDIEGAEHRAFLGAKALLPHCRLILSEVSPRFLRRAGVSLDEHLELVTGCGFDPFVVEAGRVRATCADGLRDATKGRNVVYVRRDQRRHDWFAQLFDAGE